MLKQLKRRLIFMYGITSSLILTIILTCVLLINIRESRRAETEGLEKDLLSYAQNIANSEYISASWISQIESRNHLLIRIEDNSIDLQIKNSVNSLQDSSSLFKELVKEVTQSENNFFNILQLNEIILSDVYPLPRCRNERYRGIIAKIPVKTGFLTMYAIQIRKNASLQFIRLGVSLFLLELLGTLLLFAVSGLYIQKVLDPIKRSREQQKEFIASVSHELRAPLTVIKAGISSIKNDLSKEKPEIDSMLKARRYIFPIESECLRMNRLINDMLLLSSAEQGSWTIRKEAVDLETLLIEVYDAYCVLHSEDTRSIRIDLSDEPLHQICGDYERLKQVCMILLDNALSYTSADKAIILRAYNKKSTVWIEVEDHGDGMTGEEKDRVFDAFYRRESARNDKNHFGLGLSIARQIITLHSSTISIKDTAGGGTTFCICLNVP